MALTLDEILAQQNLRKAASQQPQPEPEAQQAIELPVWEFTSDLVHTFMLHGKPLSLPYKTQNPFIANLIAQEYVQPGIFTMRKLPPEPLKYVSLRVNIQ